MKTKVDIGLDIGIASVGWALVEAETSKIIKHGVRLFDAMDHSGKLKNEQRREKRSARRQVNRRRTLKRDFVKFLFDRHLIKLPGYDDNYDLSNDLDAKFLDVFRKEFINSKDVRQQIDSTRVLEKYRSLINVEKDSVFNSQHAKGLGVFYLRKIGMQEQLNNAEFVNVLYWYILHRGFKYEMVKEKNDKKNNNKEKELKSLFGFYDETTDKKSFPVDTQLAYYEKYHMLNGSLNRHFKSEEYIEEINTIWDHQDGQKYPNSAREEFLSLFSRQRSFEDGPGGPKSPSRYGLWTLYDEENDSFVKQNKNKGNQFVVKQQWKTVWEKTVGKCSVYKDKFRAPSTSASAELFNLLNDLNNLSVTEKENEKLTFEDKKELVSRSLRVLNNKKTILDYINKKYFGGLGEGNFLIGARVNKSKEILFSSLKSIHIIQKKLSKKKASFDDFFDKDGQYINNNIYDSISKILNGTKVVEKRQEALKIILPKETDETILNLARIDDSFSGTHSLSFEALHDYLPLLLIENTNQANLNLVLRPFIEHDLVNIKNQENPFSTHWVEKLVASPTVKQSVRESLKVLKALFELIKDNDFQLQDVVIEMIREQNSKDEKKAISARQEYREKINNQIKYIIDDFLKENPSIKPPRRIFDKVWLWKQQCERDAYSDDPNPIALKDVFDSHKFDIDHIFPRELTFDNSRENLVLTSQQINQKKGMRTPYYFLSEREFARKTKEWGKWYLDRAENDPFKSEAKFKFVTSQLDITKPENQVGFVGRNLVDTSYAISELVNFLNILSQNKNQKFKVKTISGKATSFARRNLERYDKKLSRPIDCGPQFLQDGKKSRIWNGHHAEDAYLITVLSKNYRDNTLLSRIYENPRRSFEKLLPNSGFSFTNSLSWKEYKSLMESLAAAREELNNNLENVKFSRKVSFKKNTILFNESIYAGRELKENENEKAEENEDLEKSEKENSEKQCKPILIKKIITIDLLKSSTKKLKKYFEITNSNNSHLGNLESEEEDENENFEILLKKSSPNKWKDLEAIYNAWKDEDNTSRLPFAEAFADSFIKSGKVFAPAITKRIRIELSKPKELSKIVLAGNNHKYSFYDTMNWVELRVFEKNSGEKFIIPINATNAKFSGSGPVEIKVKEYNAQLCNLKLNTATQMQTLKYGDIIKLSNNRLFVLIGFDAEGVRLELKPLHKLRDVEPRHYTLTKALLNSSFVKLDILGRVYHEAKLF